MHSYRVTETIVMEGQGTSTQCEEPNTTQEVLSLCTQEFEEPKEMITLTDCKSQYNFVTVTKFSF